ncbi:type III pantothenate kinase [Aestuariirhabdus litorea]|uniref:Type III pantothenate kinase n=1 Tax=Aestuariirhabdus litorea TaxID=2528527 RepID=A0A3P3VIJ4_9GAMM|nr:type III pantothenate kinase [Aestuariirhabdus litorea]RRJ82184.1 type III pantothenate kinase [Aestuariirhabdus litorea]RWW91813.1 type III pantothenate kinase [Endozoicomonadaceae bacterium GTF-13]
MILDLDAGNTRVKWRIRGSDALQGASTYGDLQELQALLTHYAPARVCLGAVVRDDKLDRLVQAVNAVWAGSLEQVSVIDHFAGIELAYEDVSLLGVDRWLAILAARNRFPEDNLVVVDCGSAATLDILTRDGVHVGGYIVPGFSMMRRVLFDNTDRVKVTEDTLAALAPGRSTLEAVNHGVLRMLKSLVLELVHEVEGRRLLITGGDGNVLAQLMGVEDRLYPHLVLDGIAVAMPG